MGSLRGDEPHGARGRLVAKPQTGPRYTMAELLSNSDYSEPQRPEEREWVDASPAGNERL